MCFVPFLRGMKKCQYLIVLPIFCQFTCYYCTVNQGTADEVVDWSHGRRLWELSKGKYDPLWIKGGRHCNLELYPEYIRHLKKFISFVEKLPATRVVSTEGSHPLEPPRSSESMEPPRKSIEQKEKSRSSTELGCKPRHSIDRKEKPRPSIDRTEKPRKSTDVSDKARISVDQPDKPRNSIDRYHTHAIGLPFPSFRL